MKKNYKNCRKIFLLFVGILFYSNSLPAQPARPLPLMWVSKDESIKRANQFKKGSLFNASKHKRLSRIVPGDEITSIIYPLKNFQDLLDTMQKHYPDYKNLRVYIASFDNDHNQSIPHLPNFALAIIFAPAGPAIGSAPPADLGKYYFLSPYDNIIYRLNSTTRDKWIEYYITKKIPELNKTIRRYKEDDYNYPGRDMSAGMSDTRSIYYPKNNIDVAFRDEIEFQKSKYHDTITGIQINFSAITKKGEPTHHGIRNKKRLMLMFEYMKDGNIFYIDDQREFSLRRRPDGQLYNNAKLRYMLEHAMGSNNGQLCPPNCPPPPPPDGEQMNVNPKR